MKREKVTSALKSSLGKREHKIVELNVEDLETIRGGEGIDGPTSNSIVLPSMGGISTAVNGIGNTIPGVLSQSGL
jgi:hypothetical protein